MEDRELAELAEEIVGDDRVISVPVFVERLRAGGCIWVTANAVRERTDEADLPRVGSLTAIDFDGAVELLAILDDDGLLTDSDDEIEEPEAD